MTNRPMERQPEEEVMNIAAEAQAYARADFGEVNQAFVDRLLEVAGPAERLAAVDLGTGPADIPIRVLRHRPRWHVTAVDASEAMLEWARRSVEKAVMTDAIELFLVDAKDTGLPAAAFDVVFSNSILHHITDVARFWAEVKRIARPGGLVFLRDLARPPSPNAAARIVEQYAAGESAILQEEYYRSLLSAYTPSEIRAQLAAAGLGTLEVSMVTDRHLDVWGKLRG
jgi:ubiquinone/menaquinone biosynthesis C-methylase UbiE